MTAKKAHLVAWFTVFFGVLIWSGVNPNDRFTWVLEVAPAVLGLFVLAVTYRRFQFCDLTYWLILIHAIMLMIGGHYTYAKVPAFDWLKDALELSRNHYDKVGHFAQGFIPAIVAREVLLRTSPLKSGKWIFFIVVSICLALSAVYELIEWWVALATGEGAEAFLGTQGYVWDTQSDMALCLLGAVLSLLFLSKCHDASMSNIAKPGQPRGEDGSEASP